MNKVEIASVAPSGILRNDEGKQLSWIDNPSVQELLDVISSIIAGEYIRIAKQNKSVFEIASPPEADRNDEKG